MHKASAAEVGVISVGPHSTHRLIVDPGVCVMSQHRQVHTWDGCRMHTVSGALACTMVYTLLGVSHLDGVCTRQVHAPGSASHRHP